MEDIDVKHGFDRYRVVPVSGLFIVRLHAKPGIVWYPAGAGELCWNLVFTVWAIQFQVS